jgi:hypothetical protein
MGKTMTPQHTARRWLTVCSSIFLGVMSMNTAAIDSGTVKGQHSYDDKVYSLRHVHALRSSAKTEELWIYLTDAELPAAAAQDDAKLRELVGEGRLHGVKLVVNAATPDPVAGGVAGTLLLPVPAGYTDMPAFWDSDKIGGWQSLELQDKRVVGSLFLQVDAGLFSSGSRKFADTKAWSIEAEFSAPVFVRVGGQTSAGTTTLTGAQAQKSPQAEVFLAYEKALLWEGIDGAGAHMTVERLVGMKDQIKQFGAEGFKQMQIERRNTTPQGEARRKQIEKVVVDGDSAVLEVRNGPNDVDVARLAKTKDGWKIAK